MSLRIGILGCGAVVRSYHLPAALRCRDIVQVAWLVDSTTDRAHALKDGFGLQCDVTNDYQALAGTVDVVINALPNHLHYDVSRFFLSRGISVLSEKPLATTLEDAEELVRSARDSGAHLAVAYTTRFFETTDIVKRVLDSGRIGEIQSFEYQWGTPGGWQSESGYELNRRESGGGVLLVNGIHFIDRMLYWFGDVERLTYADDSWGGNEANVVATFAFRNRLGRFPGRVTLSKTHALKNRLRIQGSIGVIEVADANPHSADVRLSPAGDGLSYEARLEPRPKRPDAISYFEALLRNVVNAVVAGEALKTSGAESLRSVSLVRRCYEARTALNEPWMRVGTALSARSA